MTERDGMKGIFVGPYVFWSTKFSIWLWKTAGNISILLTHGQIYTMCPIYFKSYKIEAMGREITQRIWNCFNFCMP